MGFNPLKRNIIQNHLKILIQWVETHWNYSVVKRHQKTMGFNPLKRKIIQNHQKILIQWVKNQWNYSVVKRHQKNNGVQPIETKHHTKSSKNTYSMG